MSGENILDVTKAEMERVADAMSSIMAFMEADADGGRPEYQGKFQADIIEQSYAGLRNDMRESYGVIRDKWNEIIVNDLYQHDIRDCVDSFSAFHSRVEAFDDSFCRNLDSANGRNKDILYMPHAYTSVVAPLCCHFRFGHAGQT